MVLRKIGIFIGFTFNGTCCGSGSIYVADADETYAKAVKAGVAAVMPVKDNPYSRSGGVRDSFGNMWWVKTIGRALKYKVNGKT